MFAAVRYMQAEFNAIAELVGPFDTYEESIAWIRVNWSGYDQEDCESYQLTAPFAPTAIVTEESDNEAPF